MTQAESEIVQAFKRELAKALYRITGRDANLSASGLPVEIPDIPAEPPNEITIDRLRRSQKNIGQGTESYARTA